MEKETVDILPDLLLCLFFFNGQDAEFGLKFSNALWIAIQLSLRLSESVCEFNSTNLRRKTFR